LLLPVFFVSGSIRRRMMTLEPPRGMGLDDGMTTDAEVWRAAGLSRSGLSRFLRVAQEAVGLTGEVQVLLAGDATLKRLNRGFRGKNKATDVLSFPAYSFAPTVPGMGYGGDLAISLETAGRQAEEHGHSLRDEVRVLLLHGLLHLSGMDHEMDGGEMAAREAELRRVLGLKSGLIARVEGRAGARFASEKQVPRDARNGRQKGNGKGNGKRRSPSGMTNQKGNGNGFDAKAAASSRKGREVKDEIKREAKRSAGVGA
jgi:probable rRNA maturation factor